MAFSIQQTDWTKGTTEVSFAGTVQAYAIGLSHFHTQFQGDRAGGRYVTDFSFRPSTQQTGKETVAYVPRMSLNGFPGHKSGITKTKGVAAGVALTGSGPEASGTVRTVSGIRNGSHSMPITTDAAGTSLSTAFLNGWHLSMPPTQDGMTALHARCGSSVSSGSGYVTADVNMNAQENRSAEAASIDGSFVSLPPDDTSLVGATTVCHLTSPTTRTSVTLPAGVRDGKTGNVAVLLSGIQFSGSSMDSNRHLSAMSFGYDGNMSVDGTTVAFDVVGTWDTGRSTIAADEVSFVVLALT